MTRNRIPKNRRFVEPITLTLTINQLKGLVLLTKKQRARTKQQVLRRLLNDEFEREGIRFHTRTRRF